MNRNLPPRHMQMMGITSSPEPLPAPAMHAMTSSPRHPGQQQQSQQPGAYAPAKVLMALIGQSQKRYMFYREAAMKQDAGFGQLEMDVQNMSIALAQQDPASIEMLQSSLEAALHAAAMNKQNLDQQMQIEMFLQGALKRWLTGQPPIALPLRGSQRDPRGYAQQPYGMRQLPLGQPQIQNQQQWPSRDQSGELQQQGYMPYAQQPLTSPLQVSQEPQIPPGPVDLTDPMQAAAFMLRAEAMPLGPGAGTTPGQPVSNGQPQAAQPVYASPSPPAMPPGMQYADPAMQAQVQTNGVAKG